MILEHFFLIAHQIHGAVDLPLTSVLPVFIYDEQFSHSGRVCGCLVVWLVGAGWCRCAINDRNRMHKKYYYFNRNSGVANYVRAHSKCTFTSCSVDRLVVNANGHSPDEATIRKTKTQKNKHYINCVMKHGSCSCMCNCVLVFACITAFWMRQKKYSTRARVKQQFSHFKKRRK